MSRRTPDGEAVEPQKDTTALEISHEEYPTPAPFDVKASASAIIDDARSIQRLLKTYEENTRRLKDDVEEFICRDVEEESRFRALSVAVAQEELLSLQNANFVRFSHGYRAGDVEPEEVMPTSRMGNQNPTPADGAIRSSAKVSWAEKLHPWTPDRVVALKAYGDVREVLLGWRSRNEASNNNFAALCEDVFGADRETARFCCFFNGQLYSPFPLGLSEYVAASSPVLQNCFWDLFEALGGRNLPDVAVEAAVHSYAAFSSGASSQTANQLEQHLWNGICMAGNGSTATPEGFMNNHAPQIVGDTHDCLAAVSPSRLHNTQTFRGFFMRGNLVAVEHTGPPVDVLRLLCLPADRRGGEATTVPCDYAEREKRRVVATFRGLFDEFCGSDDVLQRSAVMTLAIAPEALPEASAGGAAVPHSSGVVLSVRPIVPALPFFWHLTWAEICSMGQMLADPSKASTTNAAGVTFKCTRLAVAALTPTDTLSTKYFPVLNKQITIAQASGKRPETTTTLAQDSNTPSSGSVRNHDDPNKVAVRVAGAVAVASTAAAAAAFLLRRK